MMRMGPMHPVLSLRCIEFAGRIMTKSPILRLMGPTLVLVLCTRWALILTLSMLLLTSLCIISNVPCILLTWIIAMVLSCDTFCVGKKTYLRLYCKELLWRDPSKTSIGPLHPFLFSFLLRHISRAWLMASAMQTIMSGQLVALKGHFDRRDQGALRIFLQSHSMVLVAYGQ